MTKKIKNFQIIDKVELKTIKKIAFIDKGAKKSIGPSEIARIVEETGSSDEYLGHVNSVPQIFNFVDNLKDVFPGEKFTFEGSYYEEHECRNKSLRVFCHIEIIDKVLNESLAIEKFLKIL